MCVCVCRGWGRGKVIKLYKLRISLLEMEVELWLKVTGGKEGHYKRTLK